MTSFPQPREPGPKSPIEDILDEQHCSAATRAISNVLSTPGAELTMAQLIDGLPLCSIANESRACYIHINHPLRKHVELCHGALGRTKAWFAGFEVSKLEIENSVLEHFQAVEPGSHQFNLRLIETTVVAIHQIAVILYEGKDKSHDDGEIQYVTTWPTPSQVMDAFGVKETLPHPPLQPTLFYHYRYINYENYPARLADAGGYWAEDRIFGGVVVFDRGKSGTECKDIYFHSAREEDTVRVWKLLCPQRGAFLTLLTAEDTSNSIRKNPCPLPFTCERTSRLRVAEWNAMAVDHIYSDPWDCNVPESPNYSTIRWNTFDYPT